MYLLWKTSIFRHTMIRCRKKLFTDIDIRNGRIWYPMRNRIMEYNAKTNEIREYLPDAGQCTISDDGRKVSYFRNNAKKIILYDTVIFAI